MLARYTDASIGNTHVLNAPTQYASLRGVTPLVPNVLNGAVRLTFEDARRSSTNDDSESPSAIIADVVLSGRLAAMTKRNLKAIQAAIAAGGDIDAVEEEEEGHTALALMCKSKRGDVSKTETEIALWLIANGADVMKPN